MTVLRTLATAAGVLPCIALAAASAAAQGAPPDWMKSDAAARTVTLELRVTRPASAPSAVINGYHDGGVQIVVPLGWTVNWQWESADSTQPHSLVVMQEREKLPTEGGRPVFQNAMTRMVTAGLKPGQRDVSSFTADQAGWYWMLCGVPAHALAGEWVGLRVDPDAKAPGIKEKAGR
jgi:hypothetical protein